jgi:hypothetical protein
MIITDEILNKYLDGDLSREEAEDFKAQLNSSVDLQKKFNALKLVNEKLFDLKEDEVSTDFTASVMNKIGKQRFVVPKQQKYFIVSVATFITLLSLLVFGFSISAIISSSQTSSSESKSIFDSLSHLSDGLVTIMKNLFTGKGLSVIGSIFSIVILISGYFFFEMQKRAKATLSK